MTREMRKMFTKSQISTALATFGLLGSLDAGAFAIEPNTKVEFDFNVWDSTTISYPTSSTGVLCNSAAQCDTEAGQISGPGTTPGAVYITGLGWEDEWGIGNITAITEADTGDDLWLTSAGERLTVMFYGIVDSLVTVGTDAEGNKTFASRAQGGQVDIYMRSGNGVTVSNTPGARTGIDSYPTATDGMLFLSLAFTPSVIFDDTTHTFKSAYNTGSYDGAGSGYLDVIGGDYASVFNSDSITDPNGGLHDFAFDVTVNAQNAPFGWTARGQGEAVGETPLPGTLLLLGGGVPALLGMIGLRRRNRST